MVKFWVDGPNIPDKDGDIFTQHAWDSLMNYSPDDIVWVGGGARIPQDIAGTWGELLKKDCPRTYLAPEFIVLDETVRKDEHGRFLGVIYDHVKIKRWNLVKNE